MDTSGNPFLDDNFAKYVGAELVDAGDGCATGRLAISEHHLNGAGVVHGGAIFTLAVWTFAAAANADEQLTVGLNANISYVKAVTEGVLTARARELSKGAKVSTYEVIVTDEAQEVVAVFGGLGYKKHAQM